MPSERTLEWREYNKESVAQWRQKIWKLRNLANLEYWSYERLESEVAQLLNKELREIWNFALNYTYKTKSGSLRQEFVDVLYEIREYGTIEPQWERKLLKAIETTRRKLKK